MTAEDKESSSERQLNLDKAKFDLEKWQIEEDIKLRRDELQLKRSDFSKSRWSSPLLIAIIGLFASIVLSIIQNFYQGTVTQDVERRRFIATQDLERQRFESSLIQKALDANSKEQAADRFKSYLALGLIKDATIQKQIEKYISDPETIPLSNARDDTARIAAKLSIGTGPIENFNDLKDLIDSLPPDRNMISHVPPITNDANSGRVDEEQRNIRAGAFLYAASKNVNDDYRLVIGRDPKFKPETFMIVNLSGISPSSSSASTKLQTARQTFEKFFAENSPGLAYDFYDPPIPVEIEGSLFFSIANATGERPGPKSLKSRMPTIWQKYPITSIGFK